MKKTLALCALLALPSCVQTSTTVLDPTAAPLMAKAPEHVRIYLSPNDLPKGTRKIAAISARGDNGMTSSADFYKAVKREAASVGANGVLVNNVSEPTAGAQIAGAFLGYSAQRQATYTAVLTP